MVVRRKQGLDATDVIRRSPQLVARHQRDRQRRILARRSRPVRIGRARAAPSRPLHGQRGFRFLLRGPARHRRALAGGAGLDAGLASSTSRGCRGSRPTAPSANMPRISGTCRCARPRRRRRRSRARSAGRPAEFRRPESAATLRLRRSSASSEATMTSDVIEFAPPGHDTAADDRGNFMLTRTPHLFDDATRVTAGDSRWQGRTSDGLLGVCRPVRRGHRRHDPAGAARSSAALRRSAVADRQFLRADRARRRSISTFAWSRPTGRRSIGASS